VLRIATWLRQAAVRRATAGRPESCSGTVPAGAAQHSRSGGTVSTDHVYKTIELTGSSETSVEDAIRRAVEKAAESVRHLRWFEVTDTRGHIENNRIAHWQVTIKLGFTLED
jgi:dodecin